MLSCKLINSGTLAFKFSLKTLFHMSYGIPMSLDLHSVQISRGCRDSVKRRSDKVYFRQKGRSSTIVYQIATGPGHPATYSVIDMVSLIQHDHA